MTTMQWPITGYHSETTKAKR